MLVKDNEIIDKIQYVQDIKQLMGIEGIASRVYFDRLGEVITNNEFDFSIP